MTARLAECHTKGGARCVKNQKLASGISQVTASTIIFMCSTHSQNSLTFRFCMSCDFNLVATTTLVCVSLRTNSAGVLLVRAFPGRHEQCGLRADPMGFSRSKEQQKAAEDTCGWRGRMKKRVVVPNVSGAKLLQDFDCNELPKFLFQDSRL